MTTPIQFLADFYDGQSARRQPVQITVMEDEVVVAGLTPERRYPKASLTIAPRLAGVPRRIEFADGAVAQSWDHSTIDAALGNTRVDTLAHRLEAHLGFVFLSLAGLVLAAALGYRYGIPWAAREMAQRLPANLEAKVGEAGLNSLDQFIFDESDLDQPSREAIEQGFAKLVAASDLPIAVRLEFRDGGRVGANALALPGGVIVVTDQLVEVMPSEEEVMAVLAHELGHVKERHSLRHLLQDSITALMGLAIFGDVSGLTSVAVALPTVLINTGYSRDFEREADQYAFALLRATGRSPRLFASALSALENARDGDPAADAAEDDDEATVQGCPLPTDTQKESDTKTAADPAATPDKPADKPTDTPTAAASHDGKPQGPPSTRKPREPVGLGYFSTHPDTAERIRAALQAAQ